MSILKRKGWNWVGKVIGGIAFFVLAILVILLIIIQVIAIIAAIAGAEPVAAGAEAIVLKIVTIIGWIVLILIILVILVLGILVPLDALINKIMKPSGSWTDDVKEGAGGFLGGLYDGAKWVYDKVKQGAKRLLPSWLGGEG